jgi:hypothetical protein
MLDAAVGCHCQHCALEKRVLVAAAEASLECGFAAGCSEI